MILIRRRDPDRRMARFYALGMQADLLAGWALVREWRRIGRRGRVRQKPIPSSPWPKRWDSSSRRPSAARVTGKRWQEWGEWPAMDPSVL